MVKLLIDDQAVAIDSDFNTDIIRENPLITSTGDYSYDIDVDLRVPQNFNASIRSAPSAREKLFFSIMRRSWHVVLKLYCR